eukprot:jgi/Picsp_1/3086/NSC_01308-R1_methyl- -binding domain protein 2
MSVDKHDEIQLLSASKGRMNQEDSLLDRLRAFFAENGKELEKGWRVEIKHRKGGNSAGTSDAYYFSPAGKRFRSRAEIAREYGIEVPAYKRQKTNKEDAGAHEPLTREQSAAAAKAFADENTLPLRLSRGVKVISFGMPSNSATTSTDLVMVGFRSRWTDGESRIVFENRIEETDSGISYNVYAIDKLEGKALRYCLAKGTSPDDVWTKIADRQRHLLHKDKKSSEDDVPISPGGNNTSPLDTILRRSSSMSDIWGLERFGFVDLSCLKAIEGQPGVEHSFYHYVNQRHGWVQESVNLRKKLAERGKRLQTKPSTKSGDVQKGAVQEKVIHRLMDTMLKKVCIAHEKHETRISKQEERKKQKELRRQEKDRLRKEKLEAKKEAKIEIQDEELPGALQPPPTPMPVSPDIGHCRAEAIVTEAWQLAYRFRGVLELDEKEIPTLDAMVMFYMGPETHAGDVCPLLMSFAEFLAMDICEHAMDIVMEGDISMKKVDFVPPTRNAHMLSWSNKNWQELLHRYLFTVAVAAVNSEHSDIHTINYPLEYVHPYHVIESMTLGPTELELLKGELNPLLSEETESRIAARRDALALLNASVETKASEKEEHEFEVYANLDKILRGLMCQLYLISTRNGGRLVDLCFHSKEAVLAARTGVPLDFSNIGARIEASVYLRQGDPIKSFAADVFYVCQVILLAMERAPDAFGTEKSISRLRETVGEILKFIRHELNKLEDMGIEKCAQTYESMLSSDFPTEIISEIFDTSSRKSLLAPRNLPAPPFSCFICWKQKEGEELISCSRCGNLGHIDCLERESALGLVSSPESSLPQCLICSYSNEKRKQPWIQNVSPSSDSCLLLWEMVRKLRAEDLHSWTSGERLHLLECISRLFAECPSIKGCLQEEEEKFTKLKKKLMHARGELKAFQGKEQGQDHSHRQLREAEIRKEKLVIQISKLEEDIKKIPPSRLKPIGMDRLWNRYWELPHGALSSGRASIMIERCPHEDCNLPSEAWDIGIYSSKADIDTLVQWLNPKGAREKLLHQRLLSFLGNSVDRSALDENNDEKDSGNGICAEEVSICSSLRSFSNQILDFEMNLPRVIFHEVRGSDRALVQWRKTAKDLESPSQAIAAVLDLESLLDLSCFKVHWRLWAIPAPDPVNVSLLCTAWNRLEHLRKAVKLSSNKRYCLSLFLETPEGSKGPEKRNHSSDDDHERDQGLTDQELAMKLDAELNQRRRPATPGRRVWQLSSPRDRTGRSDRNLRKVDCKYYGESDVESDKASSEREVSIGSLDEENGEEEGSQDDDVSEDDFASENDGTEDDEF